MILQQMKLGKSVRLLVRVILTGKFISAIIVMIQGQKVNLKFNPLNTRLVCYCTVSETRLFYEVIVISCNQTQRSPGLVSE